ncbi:hypothetical protein SAY86_027573 [Trapa natans]|uniref:Uncharacterized protein n=1 Tax=Trapa natans TaxID=22666 RepID=A0AAN7KHR5_TRANT|nr:hypothetical protein SAY86_027573 [Trapa natans]
MSSSCLTVTLGLPLSGSPPPVRSTRFNGGSSAWPLSSLGSNTRISESLWPNLRFIGGCRPISSSNRRPLVCRSQLTELAPATSAVYGSLLLGGGLFAYLRSGSKGSLAGGLTGAALMAVAYYLMQSPETKAYGDALGFGSALLFSSVFGIRMAATRKLTPSGPLLVSIMTLASKVSASRSNCRNVEWPRKTHTTSLPDSIGNQSRLPAKPHSRPSW